MLFRSGLRAVLAACLALALCAGADAAPSPTTIAIVQISFWLPVVLILTLVSVVYSLGGMNYQTDSLLFQKSKDD